MSCDPFHLSITAYLDGEIGKEEENKLMAHLAQCPSCREELSAHRQIKELSAYLRLRQPEDQAWTDYWAGIYNRLERRLAWILVTAGAALLGVSLIFFLVEEFFLQQSFPWPLRLGAVLAVTGLFLLLLSVLREHSALRKSDRYEGIIR